MPTFFLKISIVALCFFSIINLVQADDDLSIGQDMSTNDLQFFIQSADLQKLSMQELDLSGDLTYQLSYSFMDRGRYEWAFNTILVYNQDSYSESSDRFLLGTFDLKNGSYYDKVAEQYKLNADILSIVYSIHKQKIRQTIKTSKEREALMDELVEYVFTNGDYEDISKFDIIFELNKLEALLVGVENVTTPNGVTVFPMPSDMEFCSEPICLEVKFGKYPRMIAQEDENTVLASINIMLEAFNKILQKPLEINLIPSHHFVAGNWNMDNFFTMLNSEIKVYTKEYPILASNGKISLYEAFGKLWNTMISFGETAVSFAEGVYSGFDNAVSLKDKIFARDKKEQDVGEEDNYSYLDKVKGYLKELKLTDDEIDRMFNDFDQADLDKIKELDITEEDIDNKFKSLSDSEEAKIEEKIGWKSAASQWERNTEFIWGKIFKTEVLIWPVLNSYLLKKIAEMSNTDGVDRTQQQDNMKAVNKAKAIIGWSDYIMEQLLEMADYFDRFQQNSEELNHLLRDWINPEDYEEYKDSWRE